MTEKNEKTNRIWVAVMVSAFVLLAVLEAYIPMRTTLADGASEGAAAAPNALARAAHTGGTISSDKEDSIKSQYEGIIRFHVKANSDSEEDQELKMMVKNGVFAKLENGITNALSCRLADEGRSAASDEAEAEALRRLVTRKYITENLDAIEEWAAECVKLCEYDYEVKAELGVTYIPAKDYDGLYFPAGNYEALTVTIGEGKGQNWWCVIFPPLCLIDCENSRYKELFDGEGDRLVLKSKLAELISTGEAQKEPEDVSISEACVYEAVGERSSADEERPKCSKTARSSRARRFMIGHATP